MQYHKRNVVILPNYILHMTYALQLLLNIICWLINSSCTSYLLWYWQIKGKGMLQKNGVRKNPGPVAFLWKAKQSVWLAGSRVFIVFVRLYDEPSDQRGRPSSCRARKRQTSRVECHLSMKNKLSLWRLSAAVKHCQSEQRFVKNLPLRYPALQRWLAEFF